VTEIELDRETTRAVEALAYRIRNDLLDTGWTPPEVTP
jgi:hypothetical protein